jgi:hypothetical protein
VPVCDVPHGSVGEMDEAYAVVEPLLGLQGEEGGLSGVEGGALNVEAQCSRAVGILRSGDVECIQQFLNVPSKRTRL